MINSYAHVQNQKFNTYIDEYVNIQHRVQALINSRPELEEDFRECAREFRRRYPEFKTYSEMTQCMVGQGVDGYQSLLETDINATMQRDPDGDWLVQILGDFDPILVNPVRCYRDPYRTDGGNLRNVAWDGQHTTMVLYILGVWGFELDPGEISIPIALYPGQDRAAIRRQFMYYNSGAGNKPLDAIDLFKQYVYGYNNDGNREFMFERCYEIQQLAQHYNLFFTHEKFGDDKQPGAVSRLSEVMNRNYSVNILDQVMYYHSITNPRSVVYPLEMDNLCHYFKACAAQDIQVDHAYIDRMAETLEKVTKNSWAEGSLKHTKVVAAYRRWFEHAKSQGIIQSDRAPRCNQTEVGPVWLSQCLKHNDPGFPVPEFPDGMTFAVQDLV